jgi:CheY-like chemotaxis protein
LRVLAALKADADFLSIPIVVLITSSAEKMSLLRAVRQHLHHQA